jgi:RNA polymerase primary sigma factor
MYVIFSKLHAPRPPAPLANHPEKTVHLHNQARQSTYQKKYNEEAMGMRQLKINKQITGRDTFSIDKYLQEIGKFGVLTPEQEVSVARRVRAGDEEAREQLVMSNLRFVVSVAKQYQNQGLTLGDLISEGNLGLIKAAGNFDETRGFKFISYAVWWIRQSIMQAIAENARLIRLPLNKISGINRVNKCYFKLEQTLQREPTPDEIAEMMDISPEEVKESMKIATKPLSMDAPLNATDEDPTNMYDLLAAGESAVSETEQAINAASLRKEIDRSLSILLDREALIIRMYYGLGGYPAMSLEEIGERVSLTSERVRQIKLNAIRKLKDTIRRGRLKTYL